MKGTEKQITWAENIQKTALDTLQRNIDRMKAANVKSYERTIKAFEKCKEELLDCFEKCDDAALYIKNRETFSSRSVLQKANEIELIMTNKELDEQFGKEKIKPGRGGYSPAEKEREKWQKKRNIVIQNLLKSIATTVC